VATRRERSGSNRDECEVKRSRTNTPLQALVMLNDPTVLEASLALADKLLQKDKSEKIVIEGFERIICRKPKEKEIEILQNYYRDQLSQFKGNTAKAEKIIKVGYYKPVVSSEINLAALMQTLQVIYNMEEAITKT